MNEKAKTKDLGSLMKIFRAQTHRLFIARGPFYRTQSVTLILFLAMSLLGSAVFVKISLNGRRREATAAGNAFVQQAAQLTGSYISNLRWALPATSRYSISFPGIPDGLRRVNAASWEALQSGEFFSAQIPETASSQIKLQDGTVAAISALGLKAIPHFSQDTVFWSDEKTRNSYAAFSNGRDVFVACLPAALFLEIWKPLIGKVSGDNSSQQLHLAAVVQKREILDDKIFQKTNLFDTPVSSTDPFLLGESQIKTKLISGMLGQPASFVTTAANPIVGFREGFGAATVPGASISLVVRYAAEGGLGLALSETWPLLAFTALALLFLILFIAANATTFYAPIADIAARLSAFGRGNPPAGLVVITPGTNHIADLIDAANEVFRNHLRQEVAAGVKVTEFEKAAIAALESVEILPTFEEQKYSNATEILTPLGRLSLNSLSAEGNLHPAMIHTQCDNGILLVLVPSHPVAIRIFSLHLTAILKTTLPHDPLLRKLFTDMTDRLQTKLPPGTPFAFSGAAAAFIDKENVTAIAGKWETTADGENQLQITVIEMPQRLRDGVQSVIPSFTNWMHSQGRDPTDVRMPLNVAKFTRGEANS